jgi:hypothetical protein
MAKKNPLDPFALNIGRLCHEWTHLESAVGAMFGDVAGMPEGPVRTMIHGLDFRDQLAAIKLGLVATSDQRSAYWMGEVIEAVDYIDNVLRPRRNRYIHDAMWDGYWGVMRSTKPPRVHKPQARAPLALRREVRVENIPDLRATLKGVRDAAEWIWQLLSLRRYAEEHEHDAEPPLIWRPQLLPPHQTGTPPPEGI